MNRSKLVAIEAGTLFTPSRRFSPACLLIEGGSIAEVGAAGTIRIPAEAEKIDASGLIVTPGFVDPHIHGSGGVDVMAGTYESLNLVSRIAAQHGTTAFLPTTVSAPPETLSRAVGELGSLIPKNFDGARPVGIHLEGPFISEARRGTHQTANVLPPDAGLFEKWMRQSGKAIRLLTIAPELEGIEAVLRIAADFGVTVAMGHSNATFDQAASAAGRGVCYAVHTFNSMRGFSHRDPGIVGEVLSDDRVFAEIIADGIHVDRAVVRFFARAKGKGRVLLASDAISATGMPDGRYTLGTDTVEVVDGVCRDVEGRLAGSTLTQEIALRNFIEWTGWTLEEALPALTENPATALKLQNKGVLQSGADADIAVLDAGFRVMKTFVAGRLVFDRG